MSDVSNAADNSHLDGLPSERKGATVIAWEAMIVDRVARKTVGERPRGHHRIRTDDALLLGYSGEGPPARNNSTPAPGRQWQTR